MTVAVVVLRACGVYGAAMDAAFMAGSLVVTAWFMGFAAWQLRSTR